MKCCNPPMLRKLDLHHLPFLHFHLYHLLSLLVISPPSFIPPHICILYKSTQLYTIAHGANSGNSSSLGRNLSRRVVYDLRRRSTPFLSSLFLLLFINYSPSTSSLWPPPSSFHYSAPSSTRFISRKWNKRVRSLLPLAKRDLIWSIHAYVQGMGKKSDGSRVLRQQGKSITRCSIEGCFSSGLNSRRIDPCIYEFYSANNLIRWSRGEEEVLVRKFTWFYGKREKGIRKK